MTAAFPWGSGDHKAQEEEYERQERGDLNWEKQGMGEIFRRCCTDPDISNLNHSKQWFPPASSQHHPRNKSSVHFSATNFALNAKFSSSQEPGHLSSLVLRRVAAFTECPSGKGLSGSRTNNKNQCKISKKKQSNTDEEPPLQEGLSVELLLNTVHRLLLKINQSFSSPFGAKWVHFRLGVYPNTKVPLVHLPRRFPPAQRAGYKHFVKALRFVYVSSGCVYGNPKWAILTLGYKCQPTSCTDFGCAALK